MTLELMPLTMADLTWQLPIGKPRSRLRGPCKSAGACPRAAIRLSGQPRRCAEKWTTCLSPSSPSIRWLVAEALPFPGAGDGTDRLVLPEVRAASQRVSTSVRRPPAHRSNSAWAVARTARYPGPGVAQPSPQRKPVQLPIRLIDASAVSSWLRTSYQPTSAAVSGSTYDASATFKLTCFPGMRR
jgi:hypothetical protein